MPAKTERINEVISSNAIHLLSVTSVGDGNKDSISQTRFVVHKNLKKYCSKITRKYRLLLTFSS